MNAGLILLCRLLGPVFAAALVLGMPALAAPDSDRLIFRAIHGGQERTLHARPSVADAVLRARFPFEALLSWSYQPNPRGMPADAAVLSAMNRFDQALRARDPHEESFLQAFCETGQGERRCVYYVKDQGAFLAALNDKPLEGVSFSGFRHDPQWTALRQALASARR